MKLLIIEPVLSGHHAAYLSNLITIFVDHGAEVVVITDTESPTFSRSGLDQLPVDYLPFVSGQSKFAKLPFVGPSVSAWIDHRANFCRLSEEHQFDAIFVPYADPILIAAALLGSPFDRVPWSGIAMRPRFHHQKMGVAGPRERLGGLKQVLFTKVIRNNSLDTLWVIDELLVDYYQGAKKLKYFPDPVQSAAELKGDVPIGCEAFGNADINLLVYGAVSLRKGLDELIEMMANWPSQKTICVMVAGRQDPGAKQLLLARAAEISRRPNVSLLCENRYFEDWEGDYLFSKADVVWVRYVRHFAMSGVVVLAASRKVPTIATNEGLIGMLTQKHHSGVVLQPGCDLDDLVQAVESAANMTIAEGLFAENSWRHLSTLVGESVMRASPKGSS